MPPALQTTSRSQYAPLFWRTARYPKRLPAARGPDRQSKEIPCAVNVAAARVAHAGAESVRQLGRDRRFELRRIFRRLAPLRLFLPKTLERLSLPRLFDRQPAPGSFQHCPADLGRARSRLGVEHEHRPGLSLAALHSLFSGGLLSQPRREERSARTGFCLCVRERCGILLFLSPLPAGTEFYTVERSVRHRPARFRWPHPLAGDAVEKGGAPGNASSRRNGLEHGSPRQRTHPEPSRPLLLATARPPSPLFDVGHRARPLDTAGDFALPTGGRRNSSALSVRA